MLCSNCLKRPTCKAICPALEEMLPKPYAGIDGKKIKFYAPPTLEKIIDEQIGQRFNCGGGKLNKPHLYD